MAASGDDGRWTRIEQLFSEAIDRPPEARESWLDSACPDDRELRDEVARMLTAHQRTDGILEQPVVPVIRSLEERLAEGLEGRYLIGRELGRGGTAVVFMAQEVKHGRPVVLKVLKPEAAFVFGVDRFRREVSLAARLNHPHILGLLDSGQVGDLLFYIMPYVGGQTLRERLKSGPLPVRETLTLLHDIGGALEHAHEAGVIHRDLKPENVLCVGGHAFLLDFGIAKLAARQSGSQDITATGVTIGTPAYMAPEQVAGKALDHRVDIYAWGLMAVEMLTGKNPASPVAGILQDATFGFDSGGHPTLASIRTEIPDDLPALIRDCLAPEPESRPASASVILQRLGPMMTVAGLRRKTRDRKAWIAASVSLVAVLLLSWTLIRGSGTSPPVSPLPLPVAVAGFNNETGDSTLAAWGRMAGDWVTQGLQETGLVTVVPWPSSLQATEQLRLSRGSDATVSPIAVLHEETGAGTIITGSYYAVGDSITFQSQITNAITGALITAPAPVTVHMDYPEQGIQLMRDRLMGAMAVWTGDNTSRVPGIAQRPPTWRAYLAFDRGLDDHIAQNYKEAAVEFETAYGLDTMFVQSLAYAATARFNTGDLEIADSLVGELTKRRDRLSPYHDLSVQYLAAMLAGQGERALHIIRRATEAAPGAIGHYNLALSYLSLNHPAEALAVLEQLDPDRGSMRGWSSYWTQLAHARHLLGDHAGERAAAMELRARYPDRQVGLTLEVRALAAARNTTAIDSVLSAARGLRPDTYWSLGGAMVVAGEELQAHGYRDAGQRYLEAAVQWLGNQLLRDPDHTAHRYWIGSALYDQGKWKDAAPYFVSLHEDEPDRMLYRGLHALTGAHIGDTARARVILGSPTRYQAGEHTMFLARLAQIRGESELAAVLFSEALAQGIHGLPWLHSTAWREWPEGLPTEPSPLRSPPDLAATRPTTIHDRLR